MQPAVDIERWCGVVVARLVGLWVDGPVTSFASWILSVDRCVVQVWAGLNVPDPR